ncbi:MAG: ABC transporter ATP-binding protein [Propionibacteriaceae bacterium]|nr:ABC transporter ATP-binding protein [Propionibacteriaceae bacterium]
MIEASGLRFSYGRSPVIDDVSLTVPARGVLGLVGPNGSGKTTLLRLLYGSLSPSAGQVLVDGQSLRGLAQRERAQAIAVVAQEAASETPMVVAELVLLGRIPHLGPLGRATAADEAAVEQALTTVGALHLASRRFAELSGGERQRVLIARALAQGATHLLLDEPTNHLDVRYQHEVLGLLAKVKAGCVVVLHDLNLAARYCQQVALLNQGRVVAQGAPHEVFTKEILEPVYGIGVRCINIDGALTLVWQPE